jgi:hypothetical protein
MKQVNVKLNKNVGWILQLHCTAWGQGGCRTADSPLLLHRPANQRGVSYPSVRMVSGSVPASNQADFPECLPHLPSTMVRTPRYSLCPVRRPPLPCSRQHRTWRRDTVLCFRGQRSVGARRPHFHSFRRNVCIVLFPPPLAGFLRRGGGVRPITDVNNGHARTGRPLEMFHTHTHTHKGCTFDKRVINYHTSRQSGSGCFLRY